MKPPPNSERMTAIGKALYYTGVLRLYKDGTGYSSVLRWWNPLSWLLWLGALIYLIPACLVVGARLADEMPSFRVSAWWRKPEHARNLEWWTRW